MKSTDIQLSERYVAILKLLDGLSTKDISLVLANVQTAVREKGLIQLEGLDPQHFNHDLREASIV